MINKVILVGNLGGDPDIRQTQSGDYVASFYMATSRTWRDANNEKQEQTEWHRVILFKKLADVAEQYLEKGSQVYIEGRLQTRKWDDKGVDRYVTEVIGETLKMLGRRSSSVPHPAESASVPASSSASDSFDDDVPF